MNKDDLLELREIFRVKMRERDFCIGEERVEELFRELLEEPEPIREVNPNSISTSSIKAEDIAKIFSELIDTKKLFERDDTFFKRIK